MRKTDSRPDAGTFCESGLLPAAGALEIVVGIKAIPHQIAVSLLSAETGVVTVQTG